MASDGTCQQCGEERMGDRREVTCQWGVPAWYVDGLGRSGWFGGIMGMATVTTGDRG